MDEINLIKAFVFGVVEGFTEFLPISSTGHLILVGNLLSANGEKAKLFEVVIQLGAILAVVWLYRDKIFSMFSKLPNDKNVQKFGLGLMAAFMPAAIFGLAFHKFIKVHLFNPYTVSLALVVGGVLIIVIENMKHSNRICDLEDIPIMAAFAVGIYQVLALFPGVSRSGATIMGALLVGMNRKTAAEFSFFLAIPTMLAATIFDLVKDIKILSSSDISMLGVGFITAFISAIIVIRWLIKYVSNHDFKLFAYYRIIFGGALLYYLH